MAPLEPYKAEFIQRLLDADVLKIGGSYELKSKRLSPYFVKLDRVDDGRGLHALGDAYADAILTAVSESSFEGVVGIPEKAHTFGPAIVLGLERRGVNKTYSSWRTVPKTYGDATSTGQRTKEQMQKEYVLGAPIPNGSRLVLVDDVMTAGDAKNKALEMLHSLADNVEIRALVIAADRQEIDEYGENAIAAFSCRNNIPVSSVITASDIFDYLMTDRHIPAADADGFMNYFRAWGTKELRQHHNLSNEPVIQGRSVVPACDIDSIERFEEILKATGDMDKIGGYKIGFDLGLRYGLPRVVELAKKHAPTKPIIYDHQKGGTDIADLAMARRFARMAKDAGVDAVIFFPQSGPVTQTAWTGEALQAGLEIIIGAHMTHKAYLAREGGYLRDEAPSEMYTRAAQQGITNFVVPGNNPEAVRTYYALLAGQGINPIFFAPGFIAQGGAISETGKAAGENFHAIVGRDLMNATDIRAKALELTSQL